MAKASVEKLEHTGPAKKKIVASVLQREALQGCQIRLCQKEKEQSYLFRLPDHEEGESDGRELHLDEKEGGSELEDGEERVKKGRFQGGEGGQ